MTDVVMYESNSDAIYLQLANGTIWGMGNEPADRPGNFMDDAIGWVRNEWQPNQADGQLPTTDEGLRAVIICHVPDDPAQRASLTALADPSHIGFTQRTYSGMGVSWFPTTYVDASGTDRPIDGTDHGWPQATAPEPADKSVVGVGDPLLAVYARDDESSRDAGYPVGQHWYGPSEEDQEPISWPVLCNEYKGDGRPYLLVRQEITE